MRCFQLAGTSAAFVIAMFVTNASAEDQQLLAKRITITDHATDPGKRRIRLLSKVSMIQYSDADNPGASGASVHVWSDTDDFCYILTANDVLWRDNGKAWRYNNPETNNQALISDVNLDIRIRSGVTFTLSDDAPQNTVNASVQFGPGGTHFCMHCTGAQVTTDNARKFEGKECDQAACDTEPPGCDPTATTTSTTTTLP